MVTIGWHGGLGSSKTWGVVLVGYICQDAGYHIVSDLELNPNYFPDYTFLDSDPNYNWQWLGRCAVMGISFPWERTFLLGDEWQYRSDSRMSKDMQNIVMSYLFIQSRKRGMIIGLTSKKKSYIDVRDREAEDISIKTYKKHFEDGRKCFDHDCPRRHYFEWIVIDVENNIGKTLRFNNPDPIFPLYDTNALTSPVSQFELNADELKELVKSIGAGKV